MKVIDKIAKLVEVKKDTFEYECQYIWAVLGTLTFVIVMMGCLASLALMTPYIIFGFSIPAYLLYLFIVLGIFEKKLHVWKTVFTKFNNFLEFIAKTVVGSINLMDSATLSMGKLMNNVFKKYCKPIVKGQTEE